VVKRLAAVACILAGCGEVPAFECDVDEDCNGETCTNDGFCAAADASCPSGLKYDPSAGELGGTCVGSNATGDTASDPIPLGPTTNADLGNAKDDIQLSCGVPGGRDMFFETTLKERGRIYIDTFGTKFTVHLAVLRGSCASKGPEIDCDSITCNANLVQFTRELDAGTYCVVADEEPGGGGTQLVLRSAIGPPSIFATPDIEVGDTCDQTNAWNSTCSTANAPEQTWIATSCTARTILVNCSNETTVGALSVYTRDKQQAACNPGCGSASITLTEPGAAWFVAEAPDSNKCGTVTLDFSFL
jgi:hypothetical protein